MSLDKKITTRYTGSTWSLPTQCRYIWTSRKSESSFCFSFPLAVTFCFGFLSLSLLLSLSVFWKGIAGFDVVGDSPETRRPYGRASECRGAKRKMKIFVKTLKGTHFEIEVKPEDSVPILLLLISQLLEFYFLFSFVTIKLIIDWLLWN